MRRSLGFLVAAVLVAGSAWGQVREGVELKLKRPAAGSVYTVERREDQSGAATIRDKTGKVQQPKGSKRILVYKYRETVVELSDAGQPPTVLERRYEKATQIVDGKIAPLPLQGKTVRIERKQDRYVFQVDGGQELKEQDAGPLHEEFNLHGGKKYEMIERLLPAKAVRAGETWQPDIAAFIKRLEATSRWEVDSSKAVGKVKLLRVYKKAGHRFGVLSIHLAMLPRTIPATDKQIAAPPGSKAVFDMEINGCVDGGALDAVITANVQVDTVLPGKDGEVVTLRLRNKMKETRTEAAR